MKKSFVILVVLVVFSITACGGKKENKVDSAKVAQTTQIAAVSVKQSEEWEPVSLNYFEVQTGSIGEDSVLTEDWDDGRYARGRAAGEAAGFDMDDVPSWDEIKLAREADQNHPRCFWKNKDTLYTEVNGVAESLTPEEAVEKYGQNDAFMMEYKNLMKTEDGHRPAPVETPIPAPSSNN